MHVQDYKPGTYWGQQIADMFDENAMNHLKGLTPKQESTVDKILSTERSDVTDMNVGDTSAEMVKGFLNQLAQLPWKDQNEILKTIASHVETARAATVKNLELQLQQAKKYRKPLFRRIF